jgi:hypothetical protein
MIIAAPVLAAGHGIAMILYIHDHPEDLQDMPAE